MPANRIRLRSRTAGFSVSLIGIMHKPFWKGARRTVGVTSGELSDKPTTQPTGRMWTSEAQSAKFPSRHTIAFMISENVKKEIDSARKFAEQLEQIVVSKN